MRLESAITLLHAASGDNTPAGGDVDMLFALEFIEITLARPAIEVQ